MIRGIIPLLIFFICSAAVSIQDKTEGLASYYADKFEGRATASGEPYRKNELTAAHRSLPFGTRIRVINKKNNKSVIVRVNDRGPHIRKRIIDVSRAAAEELDFIREGVTEVRIEVVSDKD